MTASFYGALSYGFVSSTSLLGVPLVSGPDRERPSPKKWEKKGPTPNRYGRGGDPEKRDKQLRDGPRNAFLDEALRTLGDHDGARTVREAMVRLRTQLALDPKNARDRSEAIRDMNRAVEQAVNWRLATQEALELRKLDIANLFYRSLKKGTPPPDIIPHPDHVDTLTMRVHGPLDERSRDFWEWLKYQVRIEEDNLRELKSWAKRHPEDDLSEHIKATRNRLRAFKRKAPTGWNVRERIRSRGAEANAIARTHALLLSEANFGTVNGIYEQAIGDFCRLPKGALEQAPYFFTPAVKVQRPAPEKPPEPTTETVEASAY